MKLRTSLTLVSLFGVALAPLATFAALPTEATDAMTSLSTDGLAMINAGWPVAAVLVGGLIMIGIFKKVAKKVAG